MKGDLKFFIQLAFQFFLKLAHSVFVKKVF